MTMKLQEFTYQAPLMGTELDVIFIAEAPCDELFATLLDFGVQCELRFSRFDQSSELSQLNQSKNASVSLLFWEIFTLSQNLYELSNGVFNPLLSPAHLGYHKNFKTHHQAFVAESVKFNTDFSALKTDHGARTIALEPGQTLDFGGFLKGWVAERMSEMTEHLPGSIINLGGDIYVRGSDLSTSSFEMEIDNPLNVAAPITVVLKNEALATSGTYNRRWGRKHHIVDGITKDSSQSDLVSASVIGPNGAEADALATACIILGSVKAQRLLDSLSLKYVLIDTRGKITQNLS